MEVAVLIFLSSGLFLGWSLGANDAANVFGTAVGTRRVKFSTAAFVCSGFIILGAVFFTIGLLLLFSPKVPWLGRLPGDILIYQCPVSRQRGGNTGKPSRADKLE